MTLSFSHLSLSPTFIFYHGGNWPTHLLVVGGSGGGSCTSGVYYCIVWFYGCLIAPYCLLVVNKRHSKGWFAPPGKSAFFVVLPVCIPFWWSALSLGHTWLRLNRYDSSFLLSLFSQGSSSTKASPEMIPKLNSSRVHRVSSPCFSWSNRNSSRGFPNFFSHRGHAVGYSLSQAGTWCWRDFTC